MKGKGGYYDETTGEWIEFVEDPNDIEEED